MARRLLLVLALVAASAGTPVLVGASGSTAPVRQSSDGIFPPTLLRCPQSWTELDLPAVGVVYAPPDQQWYHYTLKHPFNAHRVTFDMESVGVSDVWVAAYKPGSDGWCSIIWPNECNLAGYCWVLGVAANAGSVGYWPNDYLVAVASTRTWGQVETASAFALSANEDVGPNAETE